MGNFYTSVSLKNATAAAAASEMRSLNRDAYVLQAGLDVVVFDREADRQDTEVLAALAEHLATRLDTLSFAVLNHDDDVLWFQLYNRTELVTEYANRGGPRARVWALVTALASPKKCLPVWLTLHRPYLFQVFRHRRLVRQLGLPLASVGSGFDYIARGELPPNTEESLLQQVRRDA